MNSREDIIKRLVMVPPENPTDKTEKPRSEEERVTDDKELQDRRKLMENQFAGLMEWFYISVAHDEKPRIIKRGFLLLGFLGQSPQALGANVRAFALDEQVRPLQISPFLGPVGRVVMAAQEFPRTAADRWFSAFFAGAHVFEIKFSNNNGGDWIGQVLSGTRGSAID